jgi:hypothetical protein
LCQFRIALLLAILGVPASVSGLALDNGAIRIEVDPQTYSVRFLGHPGGANFIDPVHLTERQRNGKGLVVPGGVMTDVLPVSEGEAMLRRGPATVIEHTSDYLLLLGPESPSTGLRVKKEYLLDQNSAGLEYRLSVLSSLKEQRAVTIRATAQLPWGGVLKLPKTESGDLVLIRGSYPGISALLSRQDSLYSVSLEEEPGRENAVLRLKDFLGVIESARKYGTWTRSATVSSAGEEDPSLPVAMALIDDYSRTCQVALEVSQAGVNVGAPLVYVERWALTMPGESPISGPAKAEGGSDEVR